MSARHDPRLRALLKDFGDRVIDIIKAHPRTEWKWEDLEADLQRTFNQALISTHSPEELPDGVLAMISNKLSAKEASNFRAASRGIRGKVAVDDLDSYKEYMSMVDFLYDYAHTPGQKERDAKRADAKSSGKWKWTALKRLLENLDIIWEYQMPKIMDMVKYSYSTRVEVPWTEWRTTLMQKTKAEMQERLTYEAVLEILHAKHDILARTTTIGYFDSKVMGCVDPPLKDRLVTLYKDILDKKEKEAGFTEVELESMMGNKTALANRDIRARVLHIVRGNVAELEKKYNDGNKETANYIRRDQERRLKMMKDFLEAQRSPRSRQSRSGSKSASK